MNGRSATARKAVAAGLSWGALSCAVSVPVRAVLYGEQMFSGGNLGTFAVVATAAAAAAAAATWFGIHRRHTRTTD
ncbi:hypothetical protein [Streptomyces lydicus]|uniref:hypothetical protein n=1 Tax=Streptomyces lydicus TaxID=47763 RepID=UPI0010107D66|nr:hypothetical protein [Streptomyces lydicus]MCZ1005519.1 hypothetical protein [Streptomyces lydicus]